jgi:hypothetical protein
VVGAKLLDRHHDLFDGDLLRSAATAGHPTQEAQAGLDARGFITSVRVLQPVDRHTFTLTRGPEDVAEELRVAPIDWLSPQLDDPATAQNRVRTGVRWFLADFDPEQVEMIALPLGMPELSVGEDEPPQAYVRGIPSSSASARCEPSSASWQRLHSPQAVGQG